MCDPPDPSDSSTSSVNLIDANAKEASEEPAGSEAIAKVTLRRPTRTRQVAPIPNDATLYVAPSKCIATKSTIDGNLPIPPEVTSSPGGPRVRTRGVGGGGMRGGAHGVPEGQLELPPLAERHVNVEPAVNPDAPVPPTGKAKCTTKGGARKVSAKQERFEALREEADAVDSLSGLAAILDETIRTMDANRATPTKQCMLLLRRIQERLFDHHELKGEDDPQLSFSAILSRAVVTPVKELAEQVESQQRAIQNLSKRLETVRNTPIASPTSPSASPKSSYADAASKPKLTPRQAESPLPRGAGEHILVRFAGPPPPLFTLRYDEIVSKLNAHLVPLGLPSILFVQKQINESPGYFIAPCLGKEGVAILEERWADWAPGIIPGCRIVPVVAHCFVQVDGIPFASVESFESVVKQFEELNPTLGKVVGLPRWKNAPPSESRIAAAKRDGRRVPSAGSLVLRLESKDMVDRAVANGRVLLAGHAPRVGRTFPHLDVVQCWGCFKYGHVRARCNAPDANNCGGVHRADNPVCPVRKEYSEKQKQRAAELCRVLDQQSRYPPHFVASTTAASPLSPLSPSLHLQDLYTTSNSTPALRLHDLQ
ncbi:hypothetical protein C8F04DRAFT_1190768 [Mycena alexandri]|uniref:Uncharacterized protein n=1 Tax=Mycena alexandri TaxID=1745969 RepID=A0AAD6WWS0_9AGAR|nr:hypothetical protein C8F04DRAFT_1190768 [Mycena alexandri]